MSSVLSRGAVLCTVLATSCVFSSVFGVATSTQLLRPVPGLLTVTHRGTAVVVDEVPVPGTSKTTVTTVKAFSPGGALLASQTLSGLKAGRSYASTCTHIVSLSDPTPVSSSTTTEDVVMHCQDGRGYKLLVPLPSSSGSMRLAGLGGANAGGHPTRTYTDFDRPNWDDYATRTADQRSLDAAVFTATSSACSGKTPFLAWSNGAPLFLNRPPIDLSPHLGCNPKHLRLSVDETRQEWAILGNGKIVFMSWDGGTTPVVEDVHTLTSRSYREYRDLGYRHGQVAVSERSLLGRTEYVFLLDRDSLTVTDNIAVDRVLAVDIHGPGDKTAPYMWFTGLDGSGSYSLARAGLLPDP